MSENKIFSSLIRLILNTNQQSIKPKKIFILFSPERTETESYINSLKLRALIRTFAKHLPFLFKDATNSREMATDGDHSAMSNTFAKLLH